MFLMLSFGPAQIRYWSRYNLAPKLPGQVAGSRVALPPTWRLVGVAVERSRTANPEAGLLAQAEGLTAAFSVHPEPVLSLQFLRNSWFPPAGLFFQV